MVVLHERDERLEPALPVEQRSGDEGEYYSTEDGPRAMLRFFLCHDAVPFFRLSVPSVLSRCFCEGRTRAEGGGADVPRPNAIVPRIITYCLPRPRENLTSGRWSNFTMAKSGLVNARGAGVAHHRVFIPGIKMPARTVVEMVLERGDGRSEVVVAGLQDIALCGKVPAFRVVKRTTNGRSRSLRSRRLL